MRLKPVRGSIISKTSDSYTATASNNQISPEVDQRVGEHFFVCACVSVFVERQGVVGEPDKTKGLQEREISNTVEFLYHNGSEKSKIIQIYFMCSLIVVV